MDSQTTHLIDRKTLILSVLLIAVLGFIAYGNSFTGEFVYDDYLLVRDNQYIRDPGFLPNIFREDTAAGSRRALLSYRPLQLVTYMVDYFLWGLVTVGYHITNVLLHILAALALYWLINMLFKDRLLSLLTGVLWVVNPLHSEAVMYIAGRADPLYALFLLLCLIFYVKNGDLRKPVYDILVPLFYALALLSRESAIICPFLMLLYHYTFKKEIKAPRFIPIVVVTVIYAFLRFSILQHILGRYSSVSTLAQRIPTVFVALANYAKLLVVPFDLHMEYGKQLFTLSHPGVAAGVIIASLILFFAIKTRNSAKIVFFGVFWFVITLFPVSNILPVNAYMAEHWLYLPSAGFFLVLAYCLCALLRNRTYRMPGIVLTVILVGFYVTLTFEQGDYWKDPVTFFSRTLEYSKNNARIYNNLANVYDDMGKKEEAMALWQKSIAIDPANPAAFNNLAIAYAVSGRYVEAIETLNKAVKSNPNIPDLYNNLGNVYANTGKTNEAVAAYNRAIELNPNYADAYYNLSRLYYRQKKFDLAVKYCDRAIGLGYKANPDFLKELNAHRKPR